MVYEIGKDTELWKEEVVVDKYRFEVKVRCYDEGDKKVEISRNFTEIEEGKPKFTKLGRMTSEEVVALIPVMQKAIEFIKGE